MYTISPWQALGESILKFKVTVHLKRYEILKGFLAHFLKLRDSKCCLFSTKKKSIEE